jgi:hypothetical protein
MRRLENIFRKRSELSWLKDDDIFDIWLKTADFFDSHPYDKLSKRVYEINYEVISKSKRRGKIAEGTTPLLYKKMRLRAAARDKTIRNLLAMHRPTASSHSIKLARNFLDNKIPKLAVLLTRYGELDKQIRRLEFLLERIEEDFDREVEREIDIRRGK